MNYINIHTHNSKLREGIVIYNAMNINDIPKAKNNFYISTALHPWYLKPELWFNPLNDYEEIIAQDNIIAIGECGLDLTIKIKPDVQKTVFNKHLQWAEKYNKPVTIHCVKAFNEVIAMKKKANIKQPCIIHGFNNNLTIAKQLLTAGFYLSYGEALLHENSNAGQAIKQTPPERLFLETDESEKSISEIYSKAAELLEMDLELLKKQIEINFNHVFIRE
jgi:TatD DNase family protein